MDSVLKSYIRMFSEKLVTISMVCDEHIDKLWRLEGGPDDHWTLEYIGFTPSDWPQHMKFSSREEFPTWLEERVAVLSMLDTDPHNSIVFGVGRRISTYVYWVVEARSG